MLPPILGNDLVREQLWRTAAEDRLHHCYLFEGPEGVGKFTTALRLALFVNCNAAPTLMGPAERPCGQCNPCRSILAGSHPDVLVVGPDPEKTSRVISIRQARELTLALQLQRHSAVRRFVILDPADILNEEAANALLKTLEEPPAGTQFILVTAAAAALLSTVRSRSQRVRFGALSPEAMRAWVASNPVPGLDEEVIHLAQGSPGRAIHLAGGELAAWKALGDGLVNVVGQPLHRVFAYTEALGKKEDLRSDQVVDLVEELLRDVSLVANGLEKMVFHRGRMPALRSWAAALWPGGLARMSPAITEARERLKANVNGRLVLDALLGTLATELGGRA